MHSPYIDSLVSRAWEKIPSYDKDVVASLGNAIKAGSGNCAHHAALIARSAMMDGTPSMRSIYFGTDNEVTHHSAILFVDGRWIRVSTDKNRNFWHGEEEQRHIRPAEIGWTACYGATLNKVDDATRGSGISELVIPETSMTCFGATKKIGDYLNTARYLAFINEPEFGKFGH